MICPLRRMHSLETAVSDFVFAHAEDRRPLCLYCSGRSVVRIFQSPQSNPKGNRRSEILKQIDDIEAEIQKELAELKKLLMI